MSRSFADPQTTFELVRSETPISEDGYKLGEPKLVRCGECGADVLLTEDPSPGIDELGHDPRCSQRWVRSRWWVEQLRDA
jgi:hypothetical protein